jgi:hypothetical protein
MPAVLLASLLRPQFSSLVVAQRSRPSVNHRRKQFVPLAKQRCQFRFQSADTGLSVRSRLTSRHSPYFPTTYFKVTALSSDKTLPHYSRSARPEVSDALAHVCQRSNHASNFLPPANHISRLEPIRVRHATGMPILIGHGAYVNVISWSPALTRRARNA